SSAASDVYKRQTPILTGVFGATQVVAQGLALALATPSTTITLVTYAVHGLSLIHIVAVVGLEKKKGGGGGGGGG
ncbi:hypothetical protein QN392_24045, partial [Pseudomonas sp. RTS4]|nr:hypothetical protein [Pseudomonas sp. RTS4]